MGRPNLLLRVDKFPGSKTVNKPPERDVLLRLVSWVRPTVQWRMRKFFAGKFVRLNGLAYEIEQHAFTSLILNPPNSIEEVRKVVNFHADKVFTVFPYRVEIDAKQIRDNAERQKPRKTKAGT
jgi:hypothetical protein